MAASSPTSAGRRTLIRALALIAWAGLVAFVGLALGAVLRLISSGSGPAVASSVDLGAPDKAQRGLVLVKDGVALLRDDRGFYALDLTCPHLGCRPAWHAASRQFRCPCHGSAFSADGSLLRGPADRGLAHAWLERDRQGRLVAHPSRPTPANTRLEAG